jgi:hypothetical protein
VIRTKPNQGDPHVCHDRELGGRRSHPAVHDPHGPRVGARGASRAHHGHPLAVQGADRRPVAGRAAGHEPAPGASAARSYWEGGRATALAAGQAAPQVTLPVGFTTFPGEIFRAPRSWVEKLYPDVTYFHEAARGGHFAAWEEPQLFSEEIRAGFRPAGAHDRCPFSRVEDDSVDGLPACGHSAHGPRRGHLRASGLAVAGQPYGAITRDDWLDNTSLYWLTNTPTSAARLYWQQATTGKNFYAAADVSLPAAVTVFPEEYVTAPRSWTEKAYHNLIYFNEAERGGHFAAWEQPQLFSEELRAAFRTLR